MSQHQATDPPTPSALFARPRPYVIAHRGASDHAHENTWPAFRLALDAGAEALETDLWFSADGHIVCHHDATLDRLAGDPRRVDAMGMAALSRLDLRAPKLAHLSAGKILSLAELLDRCPASTLLVLELKDPRFVLPDHAARLLDLLSERIMRGMVVVIAFELAPLALMKALAPTLPVGHIALRRPLPTQPVDLFGPSWRMLQINPFYVRMVHWRGGFVAPLDPDLHRRLGRYLRMGVDAVLSNDPAETRRRIEGLRGG
jgi:glycerophosphoryl diester phosphodiesterase